MCILPDDSRVYQPKHVWITFTLFILIYTLAISWNMSYLHITNMSYPHFTNMSYLHITNVLAAYYQYVLSAYYQLHRRRILLIWSDSDRASSLICGNKMPTRCNGWYLLHILLLAQHVSGTIMPIIRSSRVLYRWPLPVVFGALVFRLSVWCGAGGYVSGLQAAACSSLQLLMMGIVLPETWWACNKICNKYHLLHLVGILFPHNNDDARSKSLQI